MRTGFLAGLVVVLLLAVSGLLAVGLNVRASEALAQTLPLAVAVGAGLALLVGLERSRA